MVSILQLIFKKHTRPIISTVLLAFILLGTSCTAQVSQKKEKTEIYADLLKAYCEICSIIETGSFEEEYDAIPYPAVSHMDQNKWNNMSIYMNDVFQRNKEDFRFAYSFPDLNQDGSPELLLLSKDGVLFSIFAINKSGPVFVDAFWAKYRASILPNGNVITFTTASATEAFYTQFHITQQGKTEADEIFGYQNETYYSKHGNTYTSLTKQEYDDMFGEYENFSEEKAAKFVKENQFELFFPS